METWQGWPWMWQLFASTCSDKFRDYNLPKCSSHQVFSLSDILALQWWDILSRYLVMRQLTGRTGFMPYLRALVQSEHIIWTWLSMLIAIKLFCVLHGWYFGWYYLCSLRRGMSPLLPFSQIYTIINQFLFISCFLFLLLF